MLKRDRNSFEALYLSIVSDFTRDAKKIRASKERPPVKGAKMAAAVKNAKADLAISAILNVKNADLTIVSGEKILKEIFGRSVSQARLHDAFSTKGRTASKKSEVFEDFEKVVREARESYEWFREDLNVAIHRIILDIKDAESLAGLKGKDVSELD